MTDPNPDPDSAQHTEERQAIDYSPPVLAEPVGGPIPEYQDPDDEEDT